MEMYVLYAWLGSLTVYISKNLVAQIDWVHTANYFRSVMGGF